MPTDVWTDTSPATLEYASTTTRDTGPLVKLAWQWHWLAVLSGLCVGVCFLTLIEFPLAIVVHLCIYAFTISMAVASSVRASHAKSLFPELRNSTRFALDIVAMPGLIILGIAPLFYSRDAARDDWAIHILGIAFLLLTVSCLRHLLFYRGVCAIARDLEHRKLARAFLVLGWLKTIYESVWLLCCALPLLDAGGMMPSGFDDVLLFAAFASFFGCFGYVVIWIAMMVLHAMFSTVVRRQASFVAKANAVDCLQINPANANADDCLQLRPAM